MSHGRMRLDDEGVHLIAKSRLTAIEESLGPPNVECPECLGTGWSCEYHVGKPWSGMVGDADGCAPDCAGPGVPCRCRPGTRRAGYVP